MTVAATKNKFTAASSALGYLHQCRYALYLLLDRVQADPDAQIAVERFDDISFENHGTPEELIQVKHHLGAAPDLADTSADIWTTIRAWSETITSGVASLPDTIFTIITTAKCAPGSAAAYLRDDQHRDVAKAHKLLLDAAGRMTGKTLAPARVAFKALGTARQRAMLDAAHVSDRSPTITNVVDRIQKLVGFPVPVARIPAFVARLEGWWVNELIKRLAGENKMPISGVALGLAIDDLRASFATDSLPIDFRGAHPPASSASEFRVFVQQLRLIQLDDKNINHARVDFYRAFSQRSRWLKDDLLNVAQLDDYDSSLTEEWERERDWIEMEVKDGESDEEVCKRGTALYRNLQVNCRAIRPNCTEPYVGRGSYHLLADRKRVGWHRDFLARLGGELGKSDRIAKGESSGSVE